MISVLDESNKEALGALRELDIPVVVLDRTVPAELAVSRVLSDHRSGMKAARCTCSSSATVGSG